MSVKFLLAAALGLGLASGPAVAQTAAQTVTRDPVLGTKTRHVARAKPSAAAVARGDKQPLGTENGNQPDRAAAGGGAR